MDRRRRAADRRTLMASEPARHWIIVTFCVRVRLRRVLANALGARGRHFGVGGAQRRRGRAGGRQGISARPGHPGRAADALPREQLEISTACPMRRPARSQPEVVGGIMRATVRTDAGCHPTGGNRRGPEQPERSSGPAATRTRGTAQFPDQKPATEEQEDQARYRARNADGQGVPVDATPGLTAEAASRWQHKHEDAVRFHGDAEHQRTPSIGTDINDRRSIHWSEWGE